MNREVYYKNLDVLVAQSEDAIPIFVNEPEGRLTSFITSSNISFARNLGLFKGEISRVILSDEEGKVSAILFNFKEKERFLIGSKIASLPQGVYSVKTALNTSEEEELVLGFCLESYKFDNYLQKEPNHKVKLCVSKYLNLKKINFFSKGEYFARNLINTPACDLGPREFEKIISSFAAEHGSKLYSIKGKDLLSENFPLIYQVGKAASQEPRLLEFSWGDSDGYKLTIVGKGVCYDTGGLNIKPGFSMGNMKKDMGGAASALGLASIIMNLCLPISLRVILPIVENSISAKSFRPGDIFRSRRGYSVEINNTDAEGRLILADALAYADEDSPDCLICMATLTGAARVALGPEVTPFYCDNEKFSELLIRGGEESFDPVWRMPFYEPYESLLKSDVADLDNAPSGGMAGSITAALFLKKFVRRAAIFAHFDIFAWTQKSKPGRSKGAVMQGSRAIFSAIKPLLD